MARENFTHSADCWEIAGTIHRFLEAFWRFGALAPALLKIISEIRLTVAAIAINFAACPRIETNNKLV